jgi:HEAT repeat protein
VKWIVAFVAVLCILSAIQTPAQTLQQFFQTLVDHYDPSSLPKYENLRRVELQIEGLRPEDITKALPAIFAAWAHPDDMVKGYAASAFYGIALRPDSAALLRSHVDTIGRYLTTPTVTRPETRATSIVILGSLNPTPPPEVVPIFLNFLKRTDAEAQAQGAGVIFYLAHIAPENPEVLAAIQEFLSRPTLNSKDKIDTFHALGTHGVKDARIISMMITSLDDPDEWVRFTAAQALTGIGPSALQQAEPALQRLANDAKQPANVRDAAKQALLRLHPPQR